MNWRPAASRGAWYGLAALVVVLVALMALVWLGWRSGPGPRAAVLGLTALALVPPAVWLVYWTWGCFSLRYHLSRDGLTIKWAAHRQVVPMDSVTHVLRGRPYLSPLKGLRWPGNEIGRTSIPVDEEGTDERPTLVYATKPPDGQIVLVTSSLAYAISPDDRAAFVDEFRSRRRLGSVQPLEQRTELVRWLRVSVLGDDGAVALLLAALAVNLLMFYGLTWFYPVLPPEVTLGYRFDSEIGEAVAGTVAPLSAAWWLPVVGLAVVVGNLVLAALVYRYTRMGARLLVLGALLVQFVVAVSLLKMV